MSSTGPAEPPLELAERPPLVAEPPPDADVETRVLAHLVGFDRASDAAVARLGALPGADAVFHAASAAGDWSLVWHGLGLTQALGRADPLRHAARFAAALGLESLLVNQGIKRLFTRARPAPAAPLRDGLRTPTTSSFPSGHASSAFFAVSLLTAGGRTGRAAPALWALAGVVSVSRVYVRLHHGSDVVAGAVIGLALGRAARRLMR